MTTQLDEEREEEMRSVAWEVIGGLSIAALLADCAEALVEAYQVDDNLYQQDKESVANELVDEYSTPFMSYINTIQEKEQISNDPTTTE